MAFNEVSFIGHLGKEPEVKAMVSGETVAKLFVGSSVWDKETPYSIWFVVNLWGKSAEYAGKNLHKGDMVHIVGTLIADKSTGSPRIYQRKDGTAATNYELKGRLVTRLTKKNAEKNGFEEEDEYLF